MAENTAISWADDTFNPWIGCTNCDGCYAEHLMAIRFKRVVWGPHGKPERTSEANWLEPLKWEKEQERLWAEFRMCFEGEAPGMIPPRPRFVFCASLADVFDNAVPPDWRRDLFVLIRATPHLTWLLLTKRPGNIVSLYKQACPWTGAENEWPRNAAIGCTVVTQEEADRDVPTLLLAKAILKPAFAFVSMEPLLEAVDLTRLSTFRFRGAEVLNGLTGELAGMFGDPCSTRLPALDWVIAGGETDQGAHKARPSHPDWIRSLRDQCATSGVPFHFKQWGEHREFDQGRPEIEIVEVGSATGAAYLAAAVLPIWVARDGLTFPDPDDIPDGVAARLMERVGKKAAGRQLDGVTHDARPEPPTVERSHAL